MAERARECILDALVNHITFPPRLPFSDDTRNGAVNKALVQRLAKHSRAFRNVNDPQYDDQWSIITRFLDNYVTLHSTSGSLNKDSLMTAFAELSKSRGDSLILHIEAQNSGLIIRRESSNEYVFEAFEASPRAADVLACKAALQWDFPGYAVGIPSSVFDDTKFQDRIAEFLEKASIESVKEYAAITTKAGSGAFESRDTADPALVSQLLMAILEVNGSQRSVLTTRKRVRDDVCWNDGAKNPWRRSAVWLVLRVGLQRSLCLLLGPDIGFFQYKLFMSYFLAQLCREMTDSEPMKADYLAHARAKLARRLEKLHIQRKSAPPSCKPIVFRLFSTFEKEFSSTLRLMNDRLEAEWAGIRRRCQKRIPFLPKRAEDSALCLSLLNSRERLRQLCQSPMVTKIPQWHGLQYDNSKLATYSRSWVVPTHQGFEICHYLVLADFEYAVQVRSPSIWPSLTDPDPDLPERCSKLAARLEEYQAMAIVAYNSDPEQMSRMLLTVMELWTVLDFIAVKLFPLLAEYKPEIPEDILHVLQVTRLADLHRIRAIENYLEYRHQSADLRLPSLFSDPSDRCFTVRYFDQCEPMQDLMKEITSHGDKAREAKEKEWKELSAKYEFLLSQAALKSCLYFEREDEFGILRSIHNERRCEKHSIEREAQKLKIPVHEYPLPEDDLSAAKAAVFELLCPLEFARWRDATWNIISQLGRKKPLTQDKAPHVLLHEYSELQIYGSRQPQRISLASRTKSFLKSHYAQVGLPVPLEKVCLPNGLKLGFYDPDLRLWTRRQIAKPNFVDHCTSSLPLKSSFSSLGFTLRAMSENAVASPNEIIASQTECPKTLTVFEYLSFQDLCLVPKLRWIGLLRELASPNLNFGSPATVTLVSQLALQAGRRWQDKSLRVGQWVFEDDQFCQNLIQQMKKRLDAISTNWRESQALECLITLTQQLWELAGSTEVKNKAAGLLSEVRVTTLSWTRLLRQEVLNAVDEKSAQTRSRNTLLAALLCHRTFIMELSNSCDCLEIEALAIFVECSIIINDNMPDCGPARIAKAPLQLRNMLIRDLNIVHGLKSKLSQSILSTETAMNQVINNIWPTVEADLPRSFTPWTFLAAPYNQWVFAQSISTERMQSQMIHYNIIEGSLLINGQPLSRLPDEFTKQGFFHRFLEGRVCFTYPSSMPGMRYMLAGKFEGNQVHFGFRDGAPIMRAVAPPNASGGFQVLELVSSEVFLTPDGNGIPDLPLSLITGHDHWLDLTTGVLQIRHEASKWHSRPRDWNLNIWTGQAQRRSSFLVDVRSPTFKRVSSIFEPFERPNQLVVYQPQKGNLSLRLPRLELFFEVNYQGLLESRQLRAVIDNNQDAGTFYGLESKLVLRDVRNPRERSILVTLGHTEVQQYAGHISAKTVHNGFYCRFLINDILQRLECPAESRVVYLKAYCHAVTSFVEPDPLTGRTGTEEALHCLRSGNAQPWAPVDDEASRLLSCLANLTAKRSYYPEDMKVQQKTIWMDSMAFSTQNEEYLPAVTRIFNQCVLLGQFHPMAKKLHPDASNVDLYLLERARVRKYDYVLLNQNIQVESPSDMQYLARDRTSSIGRILALEAAKLIKRGSRQIDVSRDLAAILEGWSVIQNYQENQSFQTYLLGELTNLDVPSHWGALLRACKDLSRAEDPYRAMFFFATIAFGRKTDMIIIRTLIALTIISEFQSVAAPKWDCFSRFRKDQVPTIDCLVHMMSHAIVPYGQDERSLLGGLTLNYKQRRRLESFEIKYEQEARDCLKALAKGLLSQWPCETPVLVRYDGYQYVDMGRAILLVQAEWQLLFMNYELSLHLKAIQRLLNTCGPAIEFAFPEMKWQDRKLFPVYPTLCVVSTMQDIMAATKDIQPPLVPQKASGTDIPLGIFGIKPNPLQAVEEPKSEIQELEGIIYPLTNNGNPVWRNYGKYLQSSLVALRHLDRNRVRQPPSIDPICLAQAISSCIEAIKQQFENICRSLNSRISSLWLSRGGLWPRLTPLTLLATLASNSSMKLSDPVKDGIISYAKAITHLQWLLRIEAATKRETKHEIDLQVQEQFKDEGHGEWHSKNNPDWLLLEIENNILIRPDQYKVAEAMICPASGGNSILQMNMGQGKSSVIIPMIAAVLADGKKLFRVIIPKPLLLQMAQLLQARLGGLLGRTVKHVPFSRRSATSKDNIRAYFNLHEESLRSQGIILALPEHLLSFKLSGLQKFSSGISDEARWMMKVQSWLLSKSRDVLDECDHSLAVRTQLIYPSGVRSMIDGHPNRWKVVQALLRLARDHILHLKREFPRYLEVTARAGNSGFPTVHFSLASIKEDLIQLITASVCRGEGGILPISDCSKSELDGVTSFLNDARFSKEKIPQLSSLFKKRHSARQDLLLLRGLLVHRILLMALSKRWNVQYGLHPDRDPVAVPFMAKGVPSEQAEFGHPDVAILLTCLSFYHSGLEVAQFRSVLSHVLKTDDPAFDFDRWVRTVETLPDSLRTWAAINVDDELQVQELWKHLRYSMIVIDCFLDNFVFPVFARCFERKLVSSGWDIPLPPPPRTSQQPHVGSTSQSCSRGAHETAQNLGSLTTGFSGTNDNRTLLPLNIEQKDLQGLAHTNAEVLTYLLQPRNRHYVFAADRMGRRLSEYEFLKLIYKRGIRMLLDAGAQIIELDNYNLAKTWLSMDHQAEAGVFFDKDDKARVIYRDGRSVPLVASPYNNNLGACIVYLDEAHTRGTDLKMPSNAVAALTLGGGQTKDHTVQAMRLRQLATTQSVVFYAPPEVHESILNLRAKGENDYIDSQDVIAWLLDQTCRTIEQMNPLYISQGFDYCQRTLAEYNYRRESAEPARRNQYLKILEQPENFTLEHLYAPRKKTNSTSTPMDGFPLLQEYTAKLNHAKEQLGSNNDTVQALVHQEVEQEREIAIEVETVREVEKPLRATALRHLYLHQEILDFAKRGHLKKTANAYEQAFVAMRRTGVGIRYGINSSATDSRLFVTSDFMSTVRTDRGQPRDEYLRPVQWVLWSMVSEAAMIISPYEAEALLDELCSGTHLICYSAPTTKNMLAFDTLKFYCIPSLPSKWCAPRWLVRDLGIFAGRLYFEYSEYGSICEAVGIPSPQDSLPTVEDGWNELPFCPQSHDHGKPGKASPEPFSKAPLEFLQKWLTVRRKGQDFSQTPMGHVCAGKVIKRDSVFFPSSVERIEIGAGED